MLNSFYPEIDEVIQRAIDSLTHKKIVLIDERDEDGRYHYTDFQSEEEKNFYCGHLKAMVFNQTLSLNGEKK